MTDEQEISGDEDYVGSHNMQYHGGRVIPAEEINNENEEYDDLYNDVNVGDGFKHMPMADALLPLAGMDNGGGFKGLKSNVPEGRPELKVTQEISITGLAKSSVGVAANRGSTLAIDPSHKGNLGYQASVSVLPKGSVDLLDMPCKIQGELVPFPNSGPSRVVPQMGSNQISSSANASYNRPPVRESVVIQPAVDNGNSMLFVGELHWWTTDADIENVLSQYGRVKEIKFFDERASGKSKGYCQVEFYESAAAAACKEGMHGYIFNGRACVVAFATPQSIKHMSSSYTNKTPVVAQPQVQGRRIGNETIGRGNGTNLPSGDTGRNLGRGGVWGGRGGQGMPNRGPVGGPARGRGGPMGTRNMFENTLGPGNSGGGPYGQGFAGPNFGGPPAGLIHPQAMMAPGFDPSFMGGRGAGYGGFNGPVFPGMMSPFHSVNPMGHPGVAPHVNPAFFGRGMPSNVMGMMGTGGMEGPHAPMWTDSSVGGWEGEDHGRRTRESSYGGDDNASEYGHGEGGQGKGVRSSSGTREKEWDNVCVRSGISDRGHHNERDPDRERHAVDYRYREENDSYRDNRQKERDSGYRDDLDRGQHSRSKATPEDYHRSRSNDADYAKRRRPSE